jgi:hypothetical protein
MQEGRRTVHVHEITGVMLSTRNHEIIDASTRATKFTFNEIKRRSLRVWCLAFHIVPERAKFKFFVFANGYKIVFGSPNTVPELMSFANK